MMKNIKVVTSAAVLLSCLLVACSSSPMYTDEDVLRAQNKGELYQLYDRMTLEYKQEKPSSERARNIQGYQVKVGVEIANEQERALLNNLGRDLSQHDIATLNKAKQDAASLQPYSEPVYIALVASFDQEIFLKEKIFAEKRAEFQLLTLEQAPRKVKLLDEMAVIAGGEQAEDLEQERSKYIASLFESARVNMKSQRYEQVVLILSQIEIIQPDYEGLKAMEYALIEAEYEQQFWDALGAGDKGQSLSALKRLTAIPDYLKNNQDVLSIAKDLQALFLADADKKMLNMQVIAAYDDYSKANYIQSKLSSMKSFTEGEKNFIRAIENKFLAAQERSNTVLAFGLLSILEELQYDNALVEEFAPSINNTMLDMATIKILPRQLNSRPDTIDVAQVFSNALAQQIQTDLQSKVIVYNLSKQAQLTDQELAQNPSSWFEVTGNLLHARLNSQNSAEQELKNVLVSYQTIANPDYESWSQLSSRKRQKLTEPSTTIEKPIYKDVAINRVKVTKKAELSVSYQLLNPSKGVLFFSSQDNEIKAEGLVQKSVKEGLFSVPEQEAQLPLDADMMGQVIADTVMVIGQKIKPELEKLGSRYLQSGELAFMDGRFNDAATQLAYSSVLSQSKGKKIQLTDGASTIEKMRLSMMRWQ